MVVDSFFKTMKTSHAALAKSKHYGGRSIFSYGSVFTIEDMSGMLEIDKSETTA